MTNGEIPSGMHVCHRCDNPPCVNPGHLFLGTVRDNAIDKSAKGRHWMQKNGHLSAGQNNPNAVLDWERVREIRRRSEEGASKIALAREFGIARTTLGHILARRTWVE